MYLAGKIRGKFTTLQEGDKFEISVKNEFARRVLQDLGFVDTKDLVSLRIQLAGTESQHREGPEKEKRGAEK